jgi:hypothetical protein
MIKVGFTGTHRGMTYGQRKAVRRLLLLLRGAEFHHGDCIGSDDEAHDIAVSVGLLPFIHPPRNSSKRAWKSSPNIAETREYLVRNHDIVNQTDMLIATPDGYKEKLRSGTWATIRYARSIHKLIYLVWLNGDVVTVWG